MTVADAFAHIRNTGTDKETIYTCYVTDNERRLIGLVTARTLFLSAENKLISEIMEPNVIFSRTHDDREELINNFRKYGFLAMPVVDNENRLVGIVTFDDVLRIQEEEATEDFEKMAAMSPSEKPYLKTSIRALSKNRIPWLFLLNLSVFVTGAVVKNFEDALAVLPVLITFIPMLMDTSGDAGSQSSTLIIRGMALGEIKLSDFFAVLWKELRVAFICGGILAIINFARVVVFSRGFSLALATSLALFTATVLAKTVGAMLPLGAKVVKLDPAVMAGPILTTIVDTATLMVYFSLAMLILRI
jgi:magnesium transporter